MGKLLLVDPTGDCSPNYVVDRYKEPEDKILQFFKCTIIICIRTNLTSEYMRPPAPLSMGCVLKLIGYGYKISRDKKRR